MESSSEPIVVPDVRQRFEALDALRGFVMFIIIGGDELIHQIGMHAGVQPFTFLSHQVEHSEWNGFSFYDAVFPMFLFAAGAAIPFSYLRRVEAGITSRRQEVIAGLKRMVILIILGLVVNGIFAGGWGCWGENIRFASVLGRIGIAWFLALLIALFFSRRGMVLWFAGILIGYWAAMMLIPFPGGTAGSLEQGKNLADFIDQTLMPGRLYGINHDPEGLMGAIPAVATALLGFFAGDFMRKSSKSELAKTGMLFVSGLAAVLIAEIWDIFFPVNKNLWTSSFVLMAGGISLITLAFFNLLMTTLHARTVCLFFIIIGMNSIAIYVVHSNFIDFEYTANALFSGVVNAMPGPLKNWHDIFMTIGAIAVEWLFLFFLWKKKIFIRV